QPRHGVTKGPYLLALREGTRRVIHRDLDGTVALADELDHQLEVEIEAIAFEFETMETVAAEDLEHREGIGQRLPIQRVEEPEEDDVAGVVEQGSKRHVDKLSHLPDVLALKMARADHEGLTAAHERPQKVVIVVEVVLEIGVLDDDEVTGRVPEALAHGVALAARPVLEDDLHTGSVAELLDLFAGPVGGSAFDDDDLAVEAGQVLGEQPIH